MTRLASFLVILLISCGGGGQHVRPVTGTCDHDHPDVCRDLAARQDSGTDGKPDPARAFELYRVAAEGYHKACEAEDGLACAQLAQLYLHGRGVVENPAEAARLDERACMLGVSRTCH